jgi:hypothetical protein
VVDRNIHANPAVGRSFERRREHLGQVSFAVDIGLETDAPSGCVDRPEHGGKDSVAVGQDFVFVATGHCAPTDKSRQVLGRFRIVGRKSAAELGRHLILGNREAGANDRGGAKDAKRKIPSGQHGHER